ncbi:hypothetical protein [Mycobacteroides immunogenum]|uniref:hypothetical protein n=1 Tax=Mycobacteroides immunogenum TaxID=83262 RepID=UPI000AD97580|nr:hypothetical protein [Mycobacteroides immunogenum]
MTGRERKEYKLYVDFTYTEPIDVWAIGDALEKIKGLKVQTVDVEEFYDWS